ncbi:MAG: hypothetical protein J5781_05030 [Clostridia bacterium]|nr:hypothetical protein [Clostridia bacterium]
MNRTKRILCFIVIAVLTLTVVLSGCNAISRKLEGVELKFQKKLSSADKLSFDVHLTISSNGTENEIDVSCYKKDNEYAYVFYPPNSKSIQYRRLFADNNLYEFASQSATLLSSGSYYTTADVPYTDDGNLLYALTKKIMLASYATLLSAGEKDKVGDADTYRYDFNFQGNQYSLWYDDENMVKVRATFNSTDEEGNASSKTYTALFSNYVFGEVSEDPFKRPADMGLLFFESPIAFEDWMNILTEFATRANSWM